MRTRTSVILLTIFLNLHSFVHSAQVIGPVGNLTAYIRFSGPGKFDAEEDKFNTWNSEKDDPWIGLIDKHPLVEVTPSSHVPKKDWDTYIWVLQNGQLVVGDDIVNGASKNSTVWWRGQITNFATGLCLTFKKAEDLHCPYVSLYSEGRLPGMKCNDTNPEQFFFIYGGDHGEYRTNERIKTTMHSDAVRIVPELLAKYEPPPLEFNLAPNDTCAENWQEYKRLYDEGYSFGWTFMNALRRTKRGIDHDGNSLTAGWGPQLWHIPNFANPASHFNFNVETGKIDPLLSS